MELIGTYLAGCALLAAAGVVKAARPADTARALASLLGGERVLRVVVRAGAAAEALLGMVAIAVPRPATAGAVAASYLVFAVYVLFARSRGGPLATCGCFGTPDTPATVLHAVVDLGLAGSAAAVARAGGSGTLASVLSAQPAHGMPLVLASALCAWLVYLVMARLAVLEGIRRTASGAPGTGS